MPHFAKEPVSSILFFVRSPPNTHTLLDFVYVTTHDASGILTLYKISVEWLFDTADAQLPQQRQVVTDAKIKVEHVSSFGIQDQQPAASSAIGRPDLDITYDLSRLYMIAPGSESGEPGSSHYTILALSSSRTGATTTSTAKQHSRISRWNIALHERMQHESFKSLGSVNDSNISPEVCQVIVCWPNVQAENPSQLWALCGSRILHRLDPISAWLQSQPVSTWPLQRATVLSSFATEKLWRSSPQMEMTPRLCHWCRVALAMHGKANVSALALCIMTLLILYRQRCGHVCQWLYGCRLGSA